jgi:hypothetical protein
MTDDKPLATLQAVGVESVVKPKRPFAESWRRATWWQCPPQLAELGYPIEAWAVRRPEAAA